MLSILRDKDDIFSILTFVLPTFLKQNFLVKYNILKRRVHVF